MVAFCRIADKEIRLREPIMSPDALIIQDPTLLRQIDVFAGLKRYGFILINTKSTFEELGLSDYVSKWPANRLCTLAATDLGLKHVGRPVPNVPLLAGLAALSGEVKLESVFKAIEAKFSGKVAQGNIAAATEAFQSVRARIENAKKEATHA